jgi:hypothetical protein
MHGWQFAAAEAPMATSSLRRSSMSGPSTVVPKTHGPYHIALARGLIEIIVAT